MGMPVNPVTLTPEQVTALSRCLSDMRHDINNQLSLIIAAAELIKFSPTAAERMSKTLNDQPPKISETIGKFAAEFEKLLGITHD
jgi:hypothetical protein